MLMTKKCTKILLLLWLLCMNGVMAIEKGSVLVLLLKNGDIQTFFLKDKPDVTFEGENLKLSSINDTVVYPRAMIDNFHFVDASIIDNIEQVEKNELRIVHQNNQDICVYGLKDTDKSIMVYDINGRRCHAQITYGDSASNISLETLNKGAYIIKIGNRQSIKITKR